MHSWVYRNRTRLRLIYGSSAPALPPAMPPTLAPPAVEEAPALPTPPAAQAPPTPTGDAGRVVRGEQGVLLHPMPPRRM